VTKAKVTFLQKKLYSSFNLKLKNNNFLYTQFEDLLFEEGRFFDEVPRYEFGRLRQKRPKTDQPVSPVVEFTLMRAYKEDLD
jgi:hypothetical protein